jgi:hypothetical protein
MVERKRLIDAQAGDRDEPEQGRAGQPTMSPNRVEQVSPRKP